VVLLAISYPSVSNVGTLVLSQSATYTVLLADVELDAFQNDHLMDLPTWAKSLFCIFTYASFLYANFDACNPIID